MPRRTRIDWWDTRTRVRQPLERRLLIEPLEDRWLMSATERGLTPVRMELPAEPGA